MRVLVYAPFAKWMPHFETDLELALIHLNEGDEVKIITCDSTIKRCEPNPNHLPGICNACMSRRNNGLALIRLPAKDNIPLNLDSRAMELPEFDSLPQLMKFEVNGLDVGMAVASSLISLTREPAVNVKKHRGFISASIWTYLQVYDRVRAIIQEYSPDKLYLFNGRYSAQRPALRAGQSLGVETWVHERAGKNSRYYLAKNTYPHDRLMIVKEVGSFFDLQADKLESEKVDVGNRWFHARRAGADQAWTSFSANQKSGSLPVHFNSKKRNIAVFISSEDEFVAVDGWENPLYVSQAEGVAKIAETLSDEYHLYVRLHPNLAGVKNSQTRRFLSLRSRKITVIEAESKLDSYALLEACEKTLSFGSTVGIEAVFWGRPSILAGRAYYEELNACYRPNSHEQLVQLLESRLEPLDKRKAIKYGYWADAHGRDFKFYQAYNTFSGSMLGVDLKPSFGPLVEGKIDMLKGKLFPNYY